MQTDNRRHPITPELLLYFSNCFGKGFFIYKFFSGINATQNGKDFTLFRNTYPKKFNIFLPHQSILILLLSL